MITGAVFKHDHVSHSNGIPCFLSDNGERCDGKYLHRELECLGFLATFAREVSSSLNPGDVLDTAAKLLFNYFNYNLAIFSLAENLDEPRVYSPLDSGACRKNWLKWTNRFPQLKHRDIIGYRCLGLASPLSEERSNDSEVIIELPDNKGSIALYCGEESAGQATRMLLDGIGESLEAAIRNAREHDRVKELSLRDSLTGLYNRRVLEEFLRLEKNKRKPATTSILIIDVDDFKMINDTFGHQAGDLVLSMIGKLLLGNSRKENIVARYGGEEFAVLLINTGLETALKIAERLRIILGEQEFSYSGKRFKLSVSIGVAANDGISPDPESLIARADHALYQAKRSGKNRVCSQETLPQSTMPEKRRRSHPRFGVNCLEGSTIA